MKARTKIIPNTEIIIKTRIFAGMSKSDVAKAANLPHSSIIRAELGQGVSPKIAVGISNALGLPFEELFTISTPDHAQNGEKEGRQ